MSLSPSLVIASYNHRWEVPDGSCKGINTYSTVVVCDRYGYNVHIIVPVYMGSRERAYSRIDFRWTGPIAPINFRLVSVQITLIGKGGRYSNAISFVGSQVGPSLHDGRNVAHVRNSRRRDRWSPSPGAARERAPRTLAPRAQAAQA